MVLWAYKYFQIGSPSDLHCNGNNKLIALQMGKNHRHWATETAKNQATFIINLFKFSWQLLEQNHSPLLMCQRNMLTTTSTTPMLKLTAKRILMSVKRWWGCLHQTEADWKEPGNLRKETDGNYKSSKSELCPLGSMEDRTKSIINATTSSNGFGLFCDSYRRDGLSLNRGFMLKVNQKQSSQFCLSGVVSIIVRCLTEHLLKGSCIYQGLWSTQW